MNDSIASIFSGQQPELRQLDGLGAALNRYMSGAEVGTGLAPHGLRYGGSGAKGRGYFGLLATPSGDYSTEISSDDEHGQFPLIVPTLDREELMHLLANQQPTDAIYQKAADFASQRRAAGKSPFIEAGELRYPLPGR